MDHSMHQHHMMAHEQCAADEAFDVAQGMCLPLPNAESPGFRGMLHGNAFVVGSTAEGPRSRREISSPNMVMMNAGRTVLDDHFINLNVMATAERWTLPEEGYPELLQEGERDRHGEPFVDAQHPHSSPLMGATLSDTMRLGAGKDFLRLSYAPRGESTEGPVAFMHRTTGMVNPDAPLGHHIGQDVGHISSNVVAAALHLGADELQVSAFNGTEPEPTTTRVSFGPLNSGAARVIHEWSPDLRAMASIAYVRDPEPEDPELKELFRYSASVYSGFTGSWGGRVDQTFIVGFVRNYADAPLLASVGEEWLAAVDRSRYWGRIEALQRTAAQLAVVDVKDADSARWVGAGTLGYTFVPYSEGGLDIGIGGSVTKDVLPAAYRSAYGGNPWTGKIFLQVTGMTMGADAAHTM